MNDWLTQMVEIHYNLSAFSSPDLVYDLLRRLRYQRDEGVDNIDVLVEHAEELIAALKKLKTLVKEQ